MTEDELEMTLREARRLFEVEYLYSHYKRSGDNLTRMAEIVGMERSALYRKLKGFGIWQRRIALPQKKRASHDNA